MDSCFSPESRGVMVTVVIVLVVVCAIGIVYHRYPSKFGDAITVIASPTPGEVYRLRDIEKKVDVLEKKMSALEQKIDKGNDRE